MPNEYEKRENIEFEKINNNFFYLFIGIVVLSFIFVVLINIFYKFKGDNGDDEEIIDEDDENSNKNVMLELKPINNI